MKNGLEHLKSTLEAKVFGITTNEEGVILDFSRESKLSGVLGIKLNSSDRGILKLNKFIKKLGFLDEESRKTILGEYNSIVGGEKQEVDYQGKVMYNNNIWHLLFLIQRLDSGNISINFYDLTKLVKERNVSLDAMGVISHEIRNPLAYIGGLAGSIKKRTRSDRIKDFVERIFEGVGYLEDLVDHYTLFFSVGKGQVKVQKEKVKIYDDVISVALKSVDSQMFKRRISVDYSHSLDEEDVSICTDKRLLIGVYSELFKNAIKFGGEGERFTYGCKDLGDRYEFNVWNSGGGIPKEEIPHLFNQFYRGDVPKDVEGFGLGLNIVKQVVEGLLGGEMLQPESDGQTYADFRFRLPKK